MYVTYLFSSIKCGPYNFFSGEVKILRVGTFFWAFQGGWSCLSGYLGVEPPITGIDHTGSISFHKEAGFWRHINKIY